MLEFWIALIVFMVSHPLFARTGLRRYWVKVMGEKAYLVVYSLLSLVLLAWLIMTAQDAPRTFLWPWIHTLYWVPNILMPLACILLVSGFIVPNPLSIAPKEAGFDPQRPGLIVVLTRHPILWGFFLWAFSHLFPNGEYPIVLMFGIFVLFALAGLPMIDRKRKRELGGKRWHKLASQTRAGFLTAPALWTGRFQITRKDVIGIAGGLVLYGLLFHLHSYFFGIDPTPPLSLS